MYFLCTTEAPWPSYSCLEIHLPFDKPSEAIWPAPRQTAYCRLGRAWIRMSFASEFRWRFFSSLCKHVIRFCFFALSLHMPHMKGSRFLSKMKSDFTERNTTFLESLKIFLNGRLHREKRLENVTFSTKCLLIVWSDCGKIRHDFTRFCDRKIWLLVELTMLVLLVST